LQTIPEVLDGQVQLKNTEFATVVENNYCTHNPLKELRSMKKLSDDHPDCELIHPEGQINLIQNDCGPLSILFAELFFERQEQFIQNLKYEDEVFKLRAHHKWCLTEKVYTSRISIKQQLIPMLSSTPRPSRKRRFGQTLIKKKHFQIIILFKIPNKPNK
jgi:hypothetical protein